MRKGRKILINILSLLLIIDALILLIIMNAFQDSDSIDYDNIRDSYNEIDYSQKKDYRDIQGTYDSVDYYPRIGYNYDYNSLDYSDYLNCSEFLEYSGYSDYDEGDYCDYYDYKRGLEKLMTIGIIIKKRVMFVVIIITIVKTSQPIQKLRLYLDSVEGFQMIFTGWMETMMEGLVNFCLD